MTLSTGYEQKQFQEKTFFQASKFELFTVTSHIFCSKQVQGTFFKNEFHKNNVSVN